MGSAQKDAAFDQALEATRGQGMTFAVSALAGGATVSTTVDVPVRDSGQNSFRIVSARLSCAALG